MSRLAGGFRIVPLRSRPASRWSRVRVSGQSVLMRLIAGVAAAMLFFAARAPDRVDDGAAIDASQFASQAASLPRLHSFPSERVAPESRSPARSAAGLHAALPERADPIRVGRRPRAVGVAAPAVANASFTGGGYDATAPPALS